MTLDALHQHAQDTPEAPAVDTGGVTWSYQEIHEQAHRVARHLAGAGLGPGKRVAALVPNQARTPWILHGVPRAGATLAPLNPSWTKRELVTYLQHIQPHAVVCTQATARQAALITQGANLITLDQNTGTRAIHLDTLPPTQDPLPGPQKANPHTILPTSGTTGTPKAATFDYQTHQDHAHAVQQRLDLSAEDRWLSTLAPAHIGGLALWLRAGVLGSCVVPTPRFDPDTLNALLDEAKITHASFVPTMLNHLLEARTQTHAPPSLKTALIGGAACPAALLEQAQEQGWPIALTYGLTEAASQVATAPPRMVEATPGTVGHPLATVQVRIGDDEEILVKGSTLMEGYHSDQEAPVDGQGWLHTGDAGRIDERGRLWVTGRLSDRIVSGGLTVDPVEVENAILEHPGVAAAAVVGVEDEEWGQRVAAAVVPEQADTLDGKMLRSFLADTLASGKHPRAWRFVDALPTNANGKVDRGAVREGFAGAK